MSKFIIILKPMSTEKVKTACAAVMAASAGTALKMDWAYVDEATNQPICCWDGPDRQAVQDLFARAGQSLESIRAVAVYRAPSP
jgi:hypothetical protein